MKNSFLTINYKQCYIHTCVNEQGESEVKYCEFMKYIAKPAKSIKAAKNRITRYLSKNRLDVIK